MNLIKTSSGQKSSTYFLSEQDRKITSLTVYPQDDQLSIRIHNPFFTQPDALRILQYLEEQLICVFHPQWIILLAIDPKYHHLLNGCRYYAQGKNFKKKTDPWRLKLADRVFDDEGYIIDQGRMKEVPFGWFSTREKGCGWIAAWNLLRMHGTDLLIDTITKELSAKALLGEAMGADIFTLRRYMRIKGLHTGISLPADKDALKKMKQSDSGILLYHHLHGAHYIAYEKEGEDRFHFFNAVYGRRYHYDSLEHFIKTWEFMPFSMALYVNHD